MMAIHTRKLEAYRDSDTGKLDMTVCRICDHQTDYTQGNPYMPGGPGRCRPCQWRYNDHMRLQADVIAQFAYLDRRLGTNNADGLTVTAPTLEQERMWPRDC